MKNIKPGSMDTPTLNKVLRILKKEIQKWKVPAVGVIALQAVDRPFETLVSTILSPRTKDKVTGAASRRLLARAPTPEILASLSVTAIERLIYPVGFYHTKAGNLLKTCRCILKDHKGKVPRSMDELLELPGVGRKTANLVLTVGLATMESASIRTCTAYRISGGMCQQKPRKRPNSPCAKNSPRDTGRRLTISWSLLDKISASRSLPGAADARLRGIVLKSGLGDRGKKQPR